MVMGEEEDIPLSVLLFPEAISRAGAAFYSSTHNSLSMELKQTREAIICGSDPDDL
jgi:hypothetical protein